MPAQWEKKKTWHQMILRGPANTSTLLHSLIHCILLTSFHSLSFCPSHSFCLCPFIVFLPSHTTIHSSVLFLSLQIPLPVSLGHFLSAPCAQSLRLKFCCEHTFLSAKKFYSRAAANSQTWELSGVCTVCNCSTAVWV